LGSISSAEGSLFSSVEFSSIDNNTNTNLTGVTSQLYSKECEGDKGPSRLPSSSATTKTSSNNNLEGGGGKKEKRQERKGKKSRGKKNLRKHNAGGKPVIFKGDTPSFHENVSIYKPDRCDCFLV
jgi:hypothetical protein